MPIDVNLLEEVKAGQVVLFLGAGASLGAENSAKKTIPGTKDLAALICEKFLDKSYSSLDFVETCDLAATAKSGRELQRFIRDTLDPFYPARFHKKIPSFHWAGIATTNFDLVIERAYSSVTDRLQELKPLVRDTPEFMDAIGKGDLLYLKLHGCITAYEQVSPGMVFSTERIVRHKEGRSAQFAQFLEWAKVKTIVFAGYSLRDPDLRSLLDEIVRDGDSRLRHYIVKNGVLDLEERYWGERRFTLIDSTFEAFLDELDSSILAEFRKLSLVKTENSTSVTKFIASSRHESQALRNYLEGGAIHVSSETTSPVSTPHKFYSGFDLGWYPIENELDFSRQIVQTILQEEVAVAGAVSAPRLVILKAHAGAGKSVSLRRIAWDAARRLSKLVVFVPSTGYINIQAIQELASLAKETLFLIIEDVTLVSENVAQLIASARRDKNAIVIIGGARFNEWNIRSQVLENSVSAEYELRYLSRKEIDDLLVRLELNDCLGELKYLDGDQRVKRLDEIYGRQLLVALHEATRNANFRDIILDEYKKIIPPEAQLLYADICALNKFGSPVRAGLISRVHGISFDQFRERFFKPLEQVVSLEMDSRSSDWIYRARHPYIAEILYDQVFNTAAERFDNHMKIISRLNPAYSYDRRIIGDMLRGNKLAELFTDVRQGNAIYDKALEALGDEPHIYHQKGLYLKRLAGDLGSLKAAETALLKAQDLAPTDRTIRHSIAELALARAKLSNDSIERTAWRNEAITKATSLLTSATGSHAFHTVAKARIQALTDVLQVDDDASLSADLVSKAIQEAEDIIRSGLQRHPGDSHLLAEEANLAQLLENDDRAERALNRAFESNKISQLIAKRYALVLKAKGKLLEAKDVIRTALEHNHGSQDLNFDFAELLKLIDPGIDATNPELLLSYYQRSFQNGDKNYRAQFFCARQLILVGRQTEARALYDNLKNAPIPFTVRSLVKEFVKDESGNIRRFNGVVTARRDSYGFIDSDSNAIGCYFDTKSINSNVDLPVVGARVSFSLGFSFLKPTARDVEILG